MERIKEALERARRERGARGFGEGLSLDAGASAGLVGPVETIVYSKTRKVTVERDVLADNRLIYGRPPGVFTDAYRILATQVLQRLKTNNWNAVAVTSPAVGEGKTLTTINLAISLAMEVEKTVLLVDADLRRPSVHRYFGLEPQAGLGDLLISGVPLQDLLLHPDIGKFVILPGGTPILNSSEMLGSAKMADLVREVKTRYPSRIVLFDLPPVLSAADVLAFSPHVDCVLLVVEEGKTDSEALMRATELLKGTNLLGTVLNKSRETGLSETKKKQIAWPRWFGRLGHLLKRKGG
ncbi:MAG: CpsD/CapB family tyrosine-protein kinase [Acidiferrobacteraceae bacterium]